MAFLPRLKSRASGLIAFSERQLFIYQQLTAGRHIQKSQLAKQFAVDARTIQRDFANLRAFIDEYLPEYTLNYDRQNNSYWLSANGIGLNKAQCLCLIKILTASRALPKDQLIELSNRLLKILDEKDAQKVKQLISSEQSTYQPLRNLQNKDLMNLIWNFSNILSCIEPFASTTAIRLAISKRTLLFRWH